MVKHTNRPSPARRNDMALKCFYTSAGHSLGNTLGRTREALECYDWAGCFLGGTTLPASYSCVMKLSPVLFNSGCKYSKMRKQARF